MQLLSKMHSISAFKLKLVKGHMPTMVKYVQSSKELVESTSRVPTRFPDEG